MSTKSIKKQFKKEQKKQKKDNRSSSLGYPPGHTGSSHTLHAEEALLASQSDNTEMGYRRLSAIRPSSPVNDSSSSQRDGESPRGQKKRTNANSEALVASLLAEDIQSELAPAIKAVFEQRRENEAIEGLDGFIQNRQAEIDSICDQNYQDFIRSIKELFKIRDEIKAMRSAIISLNETLQSAGRQLVEKTKELVDLRFTSQRMAEASELLNTCLYVLALTKKVKDYVELGKSFAGVGGTQLVPSISDKSPVKLNKFYPAIKILEQIEQTHIHSIESFTFGKYLQKRIPAIRELILRKVMDNVNRWLMAVRERANVIGAFAIAQTSAQIKLEKQLSSMRESSVEEIIEQKKKLQKTTFSNFGISDAFKDIDITEVSVYEAAEDLNFAPLYQCLYIYQSLDLLDKFAVYYGKNRKLQCDLVLNPSDSEPFSATYQQYFQAITGFFIVENTVVQTAPTLVSSNHKSSWWEHAVERLKMVLRAKVNDIDDPNVLSQLKDFVLLFVKTLKSYGYETTVLLEFVAVVLRDRFLEISSNVVLTLFKKQYSEDTFVPVSYKNEKEAREQVVSLGLEKTIDNYRNQISFPFTRLIPECVSILSRFIQSSATFSKGDIELPEMDRLLIKTTENLISDIPKSYTDLVLGNAEMTISQTCCAYVNVTTFQRTLPILEGMMGKFGIGASAVKFSAKDGFEYAFRNMELKLYSVIEQFVVKAMNKAAESIQWLASKPSKDPREYVKDLVQFGSENLPKEVESLPKDLQLQSFRRYYVTIAEEFQKLLSKKTVERFNRNCVTGLVVDLEAIQRAANASPVKGLAQDFLESQQLFALLTEENIGEFLDQKIRTTKYSQLRNWRKLNLVFQRYQDSAAINNVLGFFASDRHKAVEQIKAFIASQIK